ncbi:MAG TPA: hypothetical protein VNO31_31940, partial [Umezawaea sp.]|nr:hypothetical protein [Umezawaea sp.]
MDERTPGSGQLLLDLRSSANRTQREQAAVLSRLTDRTVTRQDLSRWESERRLPGPFWREAIARSFGIPPTLLAQAVTASRNRRRAITPTVNATGLSHDAREPTGRAGGIGRREFVGLLATTALPLTSSSRAASPGRGTRLGVSDVRRLAARTARLRRLDNLLGGADTYQHYRAEAAATAATLKAATCSASVRRSGLSTLAEQQQLAGWAAFDAGLHGIAKSHYLDSLNTAT